MIKVGVFLSEICSILTVLPAIIDLRAHILEAHNTLNKLYAPRRLESQPSIESDLLESLGSSRTRGEVLLVVRNIRPKSTSASTQLRVILDSYAIQGLLAEGCTQ